MLRGEDPKFLQPLGFVMDDEVPNLQPPPNPKYTSKWAHFLAWRLGRYLTRIMGAASPRTQASIVRDFELGLKDDNRPLPGER